MILVTGSLWMKEGYRSIGVVCRELAIEAKNEAILTLFTPGLATETAEDLINAIVEKGVPMSLVVNQWDKQPEGFQDCLIRIKKNYKSTLRIFDFNSAEQSILHAKTFVVNRNKAIIGSSNLSWSGMYNNYEIAVLLEGKDAERVAKLVLALINSPQCKEIMPLVSKKKSV
jgi:phosphatidylserine/phosphatidylglycerophosphate/cardiolipin synthase-like enzyme